MSSTFATPKLTWRTTAIGSLPFEQVAPALEAAWRVGVPTLPQLPRLDPREGMLAQGLWGLPGLELAGWSVRSPAGEWDERGWTPEAIGPGPWAALPGFLSRLEASRAAVAKVQLVGPMTASRALGRVGDPSGAVGRWLTARGRALASLVRGAGAHPVVFIDEPGLALWNGPPANSLGLMVEGLQAAGATVGVHCCGEADWGTLVALEVDVLSFDARCSLRSVLDAVAVAPHRPVLCVGAVATERGAAPLDEGALRACGRDAWLSPACGLALQDEGRVGEVLGELEGLAGRLAAPLGS